MYISQIKLSTVFVKRIQTNQDSETEVLSNYKDLMASEFDLTKQEVQVVLSLYPESLKPLPGFKSALRYEPRIKFVEKSISVFKTMTENCQNR